MPRHSPCALCSLTFVMNPSLNSIVVLPHLILALLLHQFCFFVQFSRYIFDNVRCLCLSSRPDSLTRGESACCYNQPPRVLPPSSSLVGSSLESLSRFRLIRLFEPSSFPGSFPLSGLRPLPLREAGGLKWTRTTDLTLIRRAL